ncbi:MAG: aminotransferase class V-fold PLP-dependent enzyme [Candidatus Krumholzibacteriota bacterium]|nr:aminotransferase class V-fold PLP-dependent enzyme [Candidatus Krumholzibacteriota bacterium]
MDRASGSIDWQGYRADFPATERLVYYNNAAISPLSTRARSAADAVAAAFEREGILCEKRVFGRVGEIRKAAATLIGAAPEEIAFTRNTTQGVLIAANGIRWRAGENVVLPSVEFPANVYPWMAQRRRGVELRFVEPRDGIVTTEMIEAACDGRTRAVTVSWVQFSSGYRVDLARLGAFCRESGILLHVDAIQGLGALACDVERLGIDLLSAGGHKWLLAVPGIGLLYCRRGLLDELDVWNPGWLGVKDAWNFLDYRLEWRPDAARFEEGSANLLGVAALGAAIDRFLEIGPAAVEERVLYLAGALADGLADRGHELVTPREDDRRAGIVCFRLAGGGTDEAFAALREAGVVASLREGAIRLSPHFFNDEMDMSRFFTALDRSAGRSHKGRSHG